MTERDWQKDWDLCQRATPGPWKWVYYKWSDIYALEGPQDETILDDGSYNEEYDAPGDPLISPNDPNGQFIAEAREALPYWLQRVRELEGDIEALEIMLGMKDVPPPRTWVPTEWLDNLKEIAQISRDAWAYVWQLIDIYRTHDHPEIEARPIIDVLDKLFILWQCRWWYLRHTTEHEYCCKEVCNNETFRGN